MSVKLTMGEKLKDERNKLHLKISEIAQKVGISGSAISDYENDNKNPTVESLRKLAGFYGVSLDYLAGLTEVKSPDIDTRAICDRTGLTGNAVEILREWNEMECYLDGVKVKDKESERYSILLSFLIENEDGNAKHSHILESLYLRIFATLFAPQYHFTPELIAKAEKELKEIETEYTEHKNYRGTSETVYVTSDKKYCVTSREYTRIRARTLEKVIGCNKLMLDFIPLEISGNGFGYTDALGQDDIAKIYDGKIIEILSALREYANEHKETQDG